MLLSPRGEQYAKKLPELVRESVGVSLITPPPITADVKVSRMYFESTYAEWALIMLTRMIAL